MARKTSQNARIRFYDSTSTAWYLEIDADVADFTGPIAAPLTEEILDLDRGNFNAQAAYRQSDDAPLMAPVPVTFSVYARDASQFIYIRDWLRAMWDALASTPNGKTLESTEADSQRDGSVNNAAFADSNKSTFDLEYLITMSGTDVGLRYNGCFPPPEQQTLAEAEDGIPLSINLMVYGTITDITAFTGSSTDIEA